MTPPVATEGAVSKLSAPTDVTQFSSALTYATRQTGSQWLIASGVRTLELLLPDATSLGVSVKVADVSQLQSNDFITINVWINDEETSRIDERGQSAHEKDVDAAAAAAQTSNRWQTGRRSPPLNGLLRADAFPLTMQCRPPKPRYATSVDEPDDNSPTQRATRYAFARLDVRAITSKWTTEEKAAWAWVQLYVIVSMLPAEEAFNVVVDRNDDTCTLIDVLLDTNLAVVHPGVKRTQATQQHGDDDVCKLLCFRSTFWQNAYPFQRPPWLSPRGEHGRVPLDLRTAIPSVHVASDATPYHPRRPRKPTPDDGPVYARHILELGQTLTFDVASSKDAAFVQLFTRWHNQDRVAEGWRQRGTEAEQHAYLERIEANPSTLGLVGKWNGAPWGYVEVYWARESNVAPFYDAHEYDRGLHALVGEERFRGPHRVRTWMGSVLHMLFTLDPRTQRVVLEPRASNSKMISYTTMCGGHVEKLIDLPHKRAALVICPRERFFQLCPLAPLP